MAISSILVSLPTLGTPWDPAEPPAPAGSGTPLFDGLLASEERFEPLFPRERTPAAEPPPPVPVPDAAADDDGGGPADRTRILDVVPPRTTTAWFPPPADDAPRDPEPVAAAPRPGPA